MTARAPSWPGRDCRTCTGALRSVCWRASGRPATASTVRVRRSASPSAASFDGRARNAATSASSKTAVCVSRWSGDCGSASGISMSSAERGRAGPARSRRPVAPSSCAARATRRAIADSARRSRRRSPAACRACAATRPGTGRTRPTAARRSTAHAAPINSTAARQATPRRRGGCGAHPGAGAPAPRGPSQRDFHPVVGRADLQRRRRRA